MEGARIKRTDNRTIPRTNFSALPVQPIAPVEACPELVEGSAIVVRFIIIGAILLGAAIYVRYQFHQVIQQVTSTKTRTTPFRIGQPSESSRTKCIICNGTGRTRDFGFGNPTPTRTYAQTKICASCRGTGWIDNPMYGR
jgi:hypothetical protein